MTGYVMAATDADGKRLAERVVSTAPALGEVAGFGDSHRTNYVSVRHGHDDITLYGKDATGTWSVLVADAPAAVVVVMRRQHDATCRPDPDWDGGPQAGFEYAFAPEDGYVLTAIDVDGEPFGERVSSTAPTPADAAELGDRHEADYVMAGRQDGDVVTLHGRDADGSWSVIAADVDVDTAEEMCLWFDLTHHYQGRSPAGHHPLDDAVLAPEDGRMTAARAISLVVEQIRARRLDYPTQGLTADRFDGGWSVYAPVDVDDSDPMAFLDMPVGRSVFLISDAGRLKEISSSIPPRQAEEMFTAEEAYVRRTPAEERFMADLWDEVTRLDSESEGSAGISSFTVDDPSEEVIAARASRLVGPIAQQLALLGPRGWDRFTAIFSFTVSGEVAQLRFWAGKRSTEARVPEQIAVLVRRQRHLAARMPAGPWWRLVLTVSDSAGMGARMTTDYDYGDQPFPDEDLLGPEHYRNDLAAYPRAHTPAWLSAYAAEAGEPGPASRTAPHAAGASTPPSGPPQDRPASSPTRQAPTAQPDVVPPDPRNAPPASVPPQSPMPPAGPARTRGVPVLDTTVGWTHLHADPQVITYGRKSIALDEVEWVSYSATQIAEKRFMFPTFYNNKWEFQVGRYPYYGGQKVSVLFSKGGRRAEQPEEWAFLVNLARQYLEPRLLAELVAQVRRGETVTIGGSVKVNQAGIACKKPRLALPWESLSAPQLHNGMICVYQASAEKPVLTLPLSHPNAALIPDLFATLTS
ncbi:hypothetical protein [Streptomyces sp. NL15-2K]|uniref:hypothetical protein n=1 Tax=Streptomyces sp. NL15-2K TaxID=376149 RepID=UPI000FF9C89A|nr:MULTISPECIES: hypothetical protein [Actinomycetes]WKX12291.1 hypothetical protein Q4V64_34115 [Kutzneria buriramensis]GCB46209.1 hypothetical protein SNL152K_3507 [Streptomyces sp. NL15-2K]